MERPKIQSLNFLNKIQTHSFENGKEIFKQLCTKCGGKTFYESIIVIGDKQFEKEIVNCEVCEGGFIYGPKQTE